MAQDLICSGANPQWSVAIEDDAATFTFDRQSNMTVMQDDTALNDVETRAMTLIGPRDSAILVTTATICADLPLHATLLTQRGETPLVLSGCCAVQPR